MTKTANKRAIKALPALRTSLLWFKCETVRQLERKAQDATSPRLRIWLAQRTRRVSTRNRPCWPERYCPNAEHS